MAGIIAPRGPALKLGKVVQARLYPGLQAHPAESWDELLAKAREADFDNVEWLGVIGGVTAAAWVLGLEFVLLAGQPPLTAYLLRSALALPLLGILVGPAYVRRTRRGLARELQRRRAGTDDARHEMEA